MSLPNKEHDSCSIIAICLMFEVLFISLLRDFLSFNFPSGSDIFFLTVYSKTIFSEHLKTLTMKI